MEAILESRDCLSIVLGEEPRPVAGTDGKTEADVKLWRKLDATVRSIIGRGIDEDHWSYIRGKTTSQEWWKILKLAREKKEETDVLMANEAFHSYTWQPGQDVTSYITGLKTLRENLLEHNITLDEITVISKALQNLPSSYDSFIQALRLKSPSRQTLEKLLAALRIAEAEMERKGVLINDTDSREAFHMNRNRPYKRPESKNPKKNQGQTQINQESHGSSVKDRECWFCGKKGHFKADCRKRLREERSSKKKEATTSGTTVLYGIFSRNESGWIADSGAYAHITGHKEWFTELTRIKPETLTTATGQKTVVNILEL